MTTTRKTLVKPGNYTEAYIPGEDLIMRWNKLWKIKSVMYSPATNRTYIRLVLPGTEKGKTDIAKKKAKEQKERIKLIK